MLFTREKNTAKFWSHHKQFFRHLVLTDLRSCYLKLYSLFTHCKAFTGFCCLDSILGFSMTSLSSFQHLVIADRTSCDILHSKAILLCHISCNRLWNAPGVVWLYRNQPLLLLSAWCTESSAIHRNYVSWHVTWYVGIVARTRRYNRLRSPTFLKLTSATAPPFPCSGNVTCFVLNVRVIVKQQ